ncbi:hypothetical protein TUM20985_16520 [Mycobacterium antarcticum]|uniref:hypothetical protein n=1 Tax=unclassified Mycolicibacterium TaxID=2636767 RepID=UPI00238D43F8|nr:MULTISPECIES: hypothetical protein [unclassified Mycolicibacterium]BDX31105.1 hypothetical protein TUM20985_16520 [Mycolicibacterium sp. TUM20985]GLP74457.1 hypothetical protein TUM20983_15670 [Mycolicibacterium sp. TUM20983]GLP80252.1 hypothetical protein TUM20984_16720 [Mycolicibacterium sp. TUM20984]
MTALRAAAFAFGLLALTAGVLQIWAFVVTDGGRHLILGVFALAVGACVIAAAADAVRKNGRRNRR